MLHTSVSRYSVVVLVGTGITRIDGLEGAKIAVTVINKYIYTCVVDYGCGQVENECSHKCLGYGNIIHSPLLYTRDQPPNQYRPLSANSSAKNHHTRLRTRWKLHFLKAKRKWHFSFWPLVEIHLGRVGGETWGWVEGGDHQITLGCRQMIFCRAELRHGLEPIVRAGRIATFDWAEWYILIANTMAGVIHRHSLWFGARPAP